VSSDRSADRTLLRWATREKRRRQVRKRGGVLVKQETIEGTQREEQTAILIDDLSLNPLKSPAGGVAARSRSRRVEFFPREKKTEREKEFAARGGGPLAEDEEIEVPNVAGWNLLAERGIQCCWNALVGTGQPVGTRGDQSARGRLPNNNKLAPLLRVEDLGLFVFSVSSCFRPYTAPLTERSLFHLNKKS